MSRVPSRVLRQSAQRAEAAHAIDHLRAMTTRKPLPKPAMPGWLAKPVTITLAPPRKGQSGEAALRAWGVPWQLLPARDDQTGLTAGLELLVHQRDGGWGLLLLPPRPQIYSWAVRVSSHQGAAMYLAMLGHVAVHSQMPLSEALTLIGDLADIDPRKDQHPAHSSNTWMAVGIHAVDALEARLQPPRSLDDPPPSVGVLGGVVSQLAALRDRGADLSIREAELELERRITRRNGRVPVVGMGVAG